VPTNMKEIERRFLVRDKSYRDQASQVCQIRQGYIGEASGLEVRIRICAERGYITFKGKKTKGEGLEVECPVPLDEAHLLLEHCEDREIVKTRYIVLFGEHVFEVDEFHGKHEGLVIAEVELEDIAEEVVLPDWAGKEITGDDQYSNFVLACGPRGESDEGEGRRHGV